MCHVKRTAPTPAALAALALTAALTLAGCGDDEKGGGGSPGPDPTSSASEEPPTETESEPTEPTEPDTPLGTGAAPATGQELTFDALSLRLPKGWRIVSKDVEGFIARPKGLTLDYLTVQFLTNDGLTSSPEQARRAHNRSDGFPKDPPLVLPTVEVDGVPMFHRSGNVSRTTWLESFGSNSTDYTVYLTFELQPFDRTTKQQRALADSVLATVDMVE
jgi:hypothetical protein